MTGRGTPKDKVVHSIARVSGDITSRHGNSGYDSSDKTLRRNRMLIEPDLEQKHLNCNLAIFHGKKISLNAALVLKQQNIGETKNYLVIPCNLILACKENDSLVNGRLLAICQISLQHSTLTGRGHLDDQVVFLMSH